MGVKSFFFDIESEIIKFWIIVENVKFFNGGV